MMAGAKKATKAAARFGEDTRAVVLTISDGCFHGAREDRSGPAVVDLLEAAGAAVVVTETLPDELELIAAALRKQAASASLIVTTGGVGGELLVGGLAERMRAEGLRQTPMAALSRGVCGVRVGAAGRAALIVNLPGVAAGGWEW